MQFQTTFTMQALSVKAFHIPPMPILQMEERIQQQDRTCEKIWRYEILEWLRQVSFIKPPPHRPWDILYMAVFISCYGGIAIIYGSTHHRLANNNDGTNQKIEEWDSTNQARTSPEKLEV